jgi:ABC-type Fe3+/spermidine/putrescine transport system ATPase subunit
MIRIDIRVILRETGIPAIYVTHDQEEAFAIGDKLLLLRNGKIIQEGTPEQVFNHPYDADTARFFGYESIINGVICDRSIGLIETRLGSLTISSDQLMNHRTGDRVDLILRNGRLDRTDDTDFLLFGKVTDIEFKEAGWLVRMVIRDESLAFHLPQKFILGESISIFIPIREIIVL